MDYASPLLQALQGGAANAAGPLSRGASNKLNTIGANQQAEMDARAQDAALAAFRGQQAPPPPVAPQPTGGGSILDARTQLLKALDPNQR